MRGLARPKLRAQRKDYDNTPMEGWTERVGEAPAAVRKIVEEGRQRLRAHRAEDTTSS